PRLAQHLLARGEERESRAGGLSGAEQGRMLDRVARAFRAAESRQGVVKLRLHPPELGTLRIELRVEQGTLTARLEAESSTAQSLLLEHAQQLRDRLAEQGVRVDRFDVDLLNQRSSHDTGSFDQRPSSDGSAARSAPRSPSSNAPAATETRGSAPLVPAPGQLNVIV
ncbi:MAG: flagellar hook-length control protein FliK, partial [Pirellulaceae bacterium]